MSFFDPIWSSSTYYSLREMKQQCFHLDDLEHTAVELMVYLQRHPYLSWFLCGNLSALLCTFLSSHRCGRTLLPQYNF